MNPFELLGVSPDADERTIKRAYARLLKSVRPDDDPHGFQRLHEAYQRALAACAEASASPQPMFAEPALRVDEVRAEAPPAFVFDHFMSQLVARAEAGSLDELRAWLDAHPSLYALTLKHMTRDLLAERLREEGLLELSQLSLEVVAEFFDVSLEAQGERRAVGRAIRLDDTRAFGVSDRRPIRQLKRRFAWPQVMLALLLPGLAPQAGGLAARLMRSWGGVPPGLDERQVHFFSGLVTPGRIGRAHALLAVAMLLLSVSFAVLPWWLVGAWYAEVPPLAGFTLFLGAIGGLAVAAVLTVSSAWVWRQLWSGLTPLVWRYALVRRLPVGFALLAPVFSKLGVSPQFIAVTVVGLYWWRFAPAAALLASSSLSCAMLFAPEPPVHPIALGAVTVPVFLLVMDAVYATVKRVTLREAFGNRWTLVGALGSVVLAVFALTRLSG